MKKSSSDEKWLLFTLFFLTTLTIKSSAASATWTGANLADFSAGSSWNTGAEPGAINTTTNTDTATFNSNGGVVVDQNGVNLGNIVFGSSAGNYTIQPNVSIGTFLLSSGGSINDQSTYETTQDIVVGVTLEPGSSTSDGTYTFTSSVLNGGLNFANYVKGGTTTGKITLNLAGVQGEFQNQISDGGAAQGLALNVQSGDWILGASGSITATGGVTVASGATLGDYANSSNPFGSAAINNNGTVFIAQNSNQTLANTISGTGRIQLISGTTILTGNNTYTGGTLLSGGITLANSGNSTGSGAVNVNGGSLGGSGTIQTSGVTSGNAITVVANASLNQSIVSGGLSTSSLTLNLQHTGGTTSTVDLLQGAKFAFDLGASGLSDQIDVTNGTLTLNNQNFADFTFTTITGFTGTGTYSLFVTDAPGDISGSLGTNSGTFVSGSNQYRGTLNINGDVLQLLVASVPEPSSCTLLLAGLGMLIYLHKFRRRASAETP